MAKDIFINLGGYSLGIDMGREGHDETRGVILRFDEEINGYKAIRNLGAPECEIIQEMASREAAAGRRVREIEQQLTLEREWREQALSVKKNLVDTIEGLNKRIAELERKPLRPEKIGRCEWVDWNELSKRGLIVRINSEILHPLGLAMFRDTESGVSGGALIAPDGEWQYAEKGMGNTNNA